MAHDFVKDALALDTGQEGLAIDSQTGKVSFQILATLLGGVLLVCSFVATFLFGPGPDGEHGNFYATVLGALAAMLLGGPLVWVAIKDLSTGHMHFNELVALAVIAAFAIGKYQESAAIAFFMILSVLIENRTALGARASIESLIRITPTKAHRVTEGKEEQVEARDLRPGDLVRVRPGDNIPADGVVARGGSTVNQANITGESLPVDKNAGDEVFGGTINITGVMDIQVTKAGEDTTLGRVKDLILQAERTRIPIMRMIDRYASWYTPTVLMLIGIVMFLTGRENPTRAVEIAITMLVIACPCAIILATPTAMVAGLSSAARLGVLVKSVEDLEAARNLTAIVFDKTGTLTTGQLQVTRLNPLPGVEPVDLLRSAATLEHNSKHPVARAVCEVARKARLTLEEPAQFEEVSGRGVTGVVGGRRVSVGRANWLSETTPDAAAAISAAAASPETQGLSLLFVVRDGQLLGWIGLEDNARSEAPAAMDKLREMGLKRLVIVTGDRQSVAKRVAAQMHTDYQAEVLPQQKLDFVRDLKQQGHRVAMIGDGVNDAPALAAGDISIAMGAAGFDVAIHSASIALMNNNLNRIPFLIDLSRRTTSVIRQNLIFGVAFIAVFGCVAAMDKLGGSSGPIIAAVLHVFSSLVVVFNSARLVRAGEDIEQVEHEALARAEARVGRSESSVGVPAPV